MVSVANVVSAPAAYLSPKTRINICLKGWSLGLNNYIVNRSLNTGVGSRQLARHVREEIVFQEREGLQGRRGTSDVVFCNFSRIITRICSFLLL